MLKIQNNTITGTIKNLDKKLYCAHCGSIIRTDNLFIRQEVRQPPSRKEVITIVTCDQYTCYSHYIDNNEDWRKDYLICEHLYKDKSINTSHKKFRVCCLGCAERNFLNREDLIKKETNDGFYVGYFK